MMRESSWRRVSRVGVCLLLLSGLTLATPGASHAKRSKSKKSSHSRRNYVPSEATGKKLLKVLKLAEDEKYEEALSILDKMTRKKRLKAHDKALVFQNHGMMLAALERYGEAAKSFEVALAQYALPEPTMLTLKYTLAQLYMAEEKFQRAAARLREWFESAENPGAHE